jgi:hypothetical protein
VVEAGGEMEGDGASRVAVVRLGRPRARRREGMGGLLSTDWDVEEEEESDSRGGAVVSLTLLGWC